MGINLNTISGFVVVWITLLFVFFIRIKFPHFGMHFTGGQRFSFNNLDFDKNCKIHSKEDIERFRARQKIIFGIILVLGAVIISSYILSIVKNNF